MEEYRASQIEQEIGKAISDVLAKHEGGFVTRWLALIEVIDGDGDRGLWTTTSDELTAWDTCGLLTHTLHLQQRQTTCGQCGEE